MENIQKTLKWMILYKLQKLLFKLYVLLSRERYCEMKRVEETSAKQINEKYKWISIVSECLATDGKPYK